MTDLQRGILIGAVVGVVVLGMCVIITLTVLGKNLIIV